MWAELTPQFCGVAHRYATVVARHTDTDHNCVAEQPRSPMLMLLGTMRPCGHVGAYSSANFETENNESCKQALSGVASIHVVIIGRVLLVFRKHEFNLGCTVKPKIRSRAMKLHFGVDLAPK